MRAGRCIFAMGGLFDARRETNFGRDASTSEPESRIEMKWADVLKRECLRERENFASNALRSVVLR